VPVLIKMNKVVLVCQSLDKFSLSYKYESSLQMVPQTLYMIKHK